MYLYFSTGNGQPSEPALCQLYRHTFVWAPCCRNKPILVLRPFSVVLFVELSTAYREDGIEFHHSLFTLLQRRQQCQHFGLNQKTLQQQHTHTHTDHQSWMDVNVQTCSKSMLSCADVLMAIHAQTTELSSDIWISVTTRPHLWPSSPAQFSQFSIGRIVYSLSTPSCSEGWSSLVFWSKGPNFWFNWKQLVKLLATNFLVNFCPSLVTSNKQFNTFKVQVF